MSGCAAAGGLHLACVASVSVSVSVSVNASASASASASDGASGALLPVHVVVAAAPQAG